MSLSLANSKKWIKIIAPCVVLLMGVAAASYYLESKPGLVPGKANQ